MPSDAGFLEKFFKIWTIVNTVWEIVDNFLKAGGASVNPLIVANEASKEIQRKVAAGFLPKNVLDDHQKIIQGAILFHPAIQNVPQPDDSTAAVLD